MNLDDDGSFDVDTHVGRQGIVTDHERNFIGVVGNRIFEQMVEVRRDDHIVCRVYQKIRQYCISETGYLALHQAFQKVQACCSTVTFIYFPVILAIMIAAVAVINPVLPEPCLMGFSIAILQSLIPLFH